MSVPRISNSQCNRQKTLIFVTVLKIGPNMVQ